MKILITGGAGYIGSHVALFAARAGHEVTILDNFCSGDRNIVSKLMLVLNGSNEYRVGASVRLIEGDLRNSRRLRESMRGRS